MACTVTLVQTFFVACVSCCFSLGCFGGASVAISHRVRSVQEKNEVVNVCGRACQQVSGGGWMEKHSTHSTKMSEKATHTHIHTHGRMQCGEITKTERLYSGRKANVNCLYYFLNFVCVCL